MSGISGIGNNQYSWQSSAGSSLLNNAVQAGQPDKNQSGKSAGDINANKKANSAANLKSLKKAGFVECQTCKERKYQDQSNDPGVSFKAPGHINPQNSASAVMSHEQEHVTNEKAKAESEGKEVVSQSVSLSYSICPECGRSYVSGGVTRTTTAAKNKDVFKEQYNNLMNSFFGNSIDTKV